MDTRSVLLVSFQGLILDLLGVVLDAEKIGLLLHSFIGLFQSVILLIGISEALPLPGDGCLLVSLFLLILLAVYLVSFSSLLTLLFHGSLFVISCLLFGRHTCSLLLFFKPLLFSFLVLHLIMIDT